MYPRFNSQAVLAVYQALYCDGRFQRCQRYISAQSGTMPDPDLLPDGDRLDAE